MALDDFSFESLNRDFSILSFENTSRLLGDATFPTHLLPLSRDAAADLLSLSRRVQSGGFFGVLPGQGQELRIRLSEYLDSHPVLASLCISLDAAIQAHFREGEGLFAKLADFSPKDAVGESAEDPHFVEIYRDKLERLNVALKGVVCNNLSLQALLWAKATQLLQRSGLDVLATFVWSERITDELERKLEFVAQYQPTHIVLREWVDLDPAYEFRGFSVNNKLVSMSQMATMGIGPPAYPQLLSQRDSLIASAQKFYDECLRGPLAELSAQLSGLFVCDLYYHVPTSRWYVVELNPWETSAAGHLFSKDMSSLTSGNRPFELRLVSETSPEVLEESSFPQSWLQLLMGSNDTWF